MYRARTFIPIFIKRSELFEIFRGRHVLHKKHETSGEIIKLEKWHKKKFCCVSNAIKGIFMSIWKMRRSAYSDLPRSKREQKKSAESASKMNKTDDTRHLNYWREMSHTLVAVRIFTTWRHNWFLISFLNDFIS